MDIHELIPVLQVGIGPAVLISGGGLLLLSMTNRLGRAIDWSRKLADSIGKSISEEDQPKVAQIRMIFRRARILRLAISFITIALLLAALMMIVLFVSALFSLDSSIAIVSIFVACLMCTILALVHFLLDINLSLHAVDMELARFRD